MTRIILIASLLVGCQDLNKRFGLPDDNFLEESVEDSIQELTGLNIDLTPESKE